MPDRRPLSVTAIARAYRDAADFLASGEFGTATCCGQPLDNRGQCVFRPEHPTKGHPNPTGYPEQYTRAGEFIG